MLYEFYCENCNVLFEENCKMGTKEFTCPECQEMAKKKISAPAIHTVKPGMSGYDTPASNKEIDIRIGKDSEKKWEEINRYQQDKKNAREKFGKTGLVGTPEGFRPASDKLIKYRKDHLKKFSEEHKKGNV